MPTVPEAEATTCAFARVLGPFLVIAPTIVAIRSTEIDISAIVEAFFANPALPWLAGALMLFGGILIIAQHQLWSSVAAVLISLLGWFLALRGLALLIAPQLYERAAVGAEGYPALVRALFAVLAVAGLWLTYVGWIAKPRIQGA